MATTRILYPAWREYNGPTNYPFVDTATLRNDSGIFIPEGAILDAVLYPVGGGSLLRLSKVVVTQQSVTVYVGDETNDELCSGELQFDNANDELRLQDAYGRPAGLLVSEVNQLLTFLAWPPGTHAFTYAQAGFTLDVCIPAAEPAVRGFLLDDGSLMTGDVWLVGDDGIVLTLESSPVLTEGCDATSDEPAYPTIVVNIVGDPLFRRRLCGGLFSAPQFLRTITVRRDCRQIICYPDATGDFKMTVGHSAAPDTVLRIRHTGGGLRIEAVGEGQHEST